jgi:hypothetical protein
MLQQVSHDAKLNSLTAVVGKVTVTSVLRYITLLFIVTSNGYVTFLKSVTHYCDETVTYKLR